MHHPATVEVTAAQVGCLMLDRPLTLAAGDNPDLLHLSLSLRANTADQHQEAALCARARPDLVPPAVIDGADVYVEADDAGISYGLGLDRDGLERLVAWLTAVLADVDTRAGAA
jgi:hypothetical protein